MKAALREAFYEDVPAINAAITQVLKNIPRDDSKESIDRSKHSIEFNVNYFE